MSDIAVVILDIYPDDCEAFWVFTRFMQRIRGNFEKSQKAIKQQFEALRRILAFTDGDMIRFLDKRDSGHMYFTFPWFLIIFRRMASWETLPYIWDGKCCFLRIDFRPSLGLNFTWLVTKPRYDFFFFFSFFFICFILLFFSFVSFCFFFFLFILFFSFPFFSFFPFLYFPFFRFISFLFIFLFFFLFFYLFSFSFFFPFCFISFFFHFFLCFLLFLLF